MINERLIGRRRLFRLGALAVVATAASPLLRRDEAWTQDLGDSTSALPVAAPSATPFVCNPAAPTTAAGALAALVAGNALWASEMQVHPGEDTMRRTCLATNPQTPFASILSCSDSRVPPELIFDQGLGDLFVARVAGNTASGRLIDSLLYGTAHLGSQLLFVLGHSGCAAISTAVSSYPRPHPTLPFVNLVFPAVKQAKAIVKKNPSLELIPVTTNQNVVLTVKGLRKYFGLSADQVAGGVYDLGTQLVTMAVDLNT